MPNHFCDMMRENVERTCADHSGRHACPDCLIDYWPASNSYGLIIHDGGTGVISISSCPWCGANLGS
ncbi:MAG: hypothetical protein B7Z08_09370 [Sphingomonadales bacterium 32-68-7]|nr:MAG: hypothetical protein B7Z33_12005 [Sphingomonadales bacterium 12-68-11]OYX08501.1 MAG: hypothetical protein B7Z08_09370 [Sphingomonadales bacterium 32-68-7]